VTLNTSILGVVYHACTSTPLYQSATLHTKFQLPSFTDSTDMIGAKFKKGSRGPDYVH